MNLTNRINPLTYTPELLARVNALNKIGNCTRQPFNSYPSNRRPSSFLVQCQCVSKPLMSADEMK